MRTMRLTLCAIILTVLGVRLFEATAKARPMLSASARAACAAYLTELQVDTREDSIVDPEAPDLEGRIKRPSRTKYSTPEFPASLRHQHREAMVVLAGVLERDGTISHAKVIVSGRSPLFDDAALAAVREARYDSGVLLDGKAVRSFFYMLVEFRLG